MAERASVTLDKVKIEHLGFFNKELVQMKWSPLFKHYQEYEPKMLENIHKDKREHGYKVTSRRMFEVEVAIMTDVIKDLNERNINVLYVYDALLCEEEDKQVVTDAMNRIILEHGVKTSVKVDTAAIALKPQLSKEKIKNHLRSLLNKEAYRGQYGAINIMLTSFDNKTDEEFNGLYNYILESVQ